MWVKCIVYANITPTQMIQALISICIIQIWYSELENFKKQGYQGLFSD